MTSATSTSAITTEPQKLRAAVIGCGRMAHGHARGYLEDHRVKLVACADISNEAAASFADEFSITRWYSDYRQMLKHEQPDIVSICTHHHLHAPMTIDTARLAAPLAILCEKPIALDLASADEMIAACRESASLLLIGHQRRFDRQYIAAKQALQAGEVGEVLSVEAFGHPRSSLLVDSTHTIDLVRYLLGDPKGSWVMGQVDAREHRQAWGQQIEDCAIGLIGLEGGFRVLLGAGSIGCPDTDERISISPQQVEGPTYHRIVIHGTRGRLVIDGDRPVEGKPLVQVFRGDDIVILFSADDYARQPGYSAVSQEIATMIDCVGQSGSSHPLEAQSARDTLEILLAIYESSRRREAIILPLDARDNPLLTMLADGVI